MKTLLISILLGVIAIVTSQRGKGQSFSSNDFQNLNVNRTIDLTNQIVTIKTKVLIRNMKIDPIDTYRLTLLKNYTSNLLHLEAKMTSTEEESTIIKLKIHKQQRTNEEFVYYDLTFRGEQMNFEEERVLVITEYYSEQFELLPRQIALLDDQYAVYNGLSNYISFYETKTQVTKVKLPVTKNQILEYTKLNAALDGDKLFYRILDPVEPLKSFFFRVHYECNFSLSTFNNAEKIFEVSHWGNIAVEERFQIENVGAKLVGEFGRVDYDDQGRRGGKNSLRNLNARLPLRANNLWYRDEIGNVSSSRAAREWDDVRLDLELRFPLLGGWKTKFNTGYNLPTKFHVNVDNAGYYRLNLTFGLPFEDVLSKNYTVKVILPEHAVISKVNLNIESSFSVSYEKSYSFLDFFGRTTVEITMNNVFDIHKIPFEVRFYLFCFNCR